MNLTLGLVHILMAGGIAAALIAIGWLADELWHYWHPRGH